MSSTSETSERLDGRLRIALLLDAFTVPAWVDKVIADLCASEVARPALVVLNGDPPPANRSSAAHLLYRLFSRLDRSLLPASPDSFERVSVEHRLSGVPVLRVTPRRTEWSDYFPDDALDEIRGYDLDVALRFGFRILRGGALDIARHGVWSFHHDDNRVIRGGPPGFWEVMENHPVTGSVLQVLSERLDAGRVIYRSWSPTHRRSLNRNRAQVYWKSTAFVERCLESLARTGDPAAGAAARREGSELHAYADRLYRKPTNLRALGLLGRHAVRAVGSRAREAVSRKQWFPALRIDPPRSDAAPELFRFTPVLPPTDRMWADPFPVRRGDGWVVFLEEVRWRLSGGRGRIVAMDVGGNGRWSPPRPVLERPHHLSYPFVFRWQGETFLMPESARAGHLEVHRSLRFPDEWTLETTALEGRRLLDPTLHEEDGTWWLFANAAVEGAPHAHDELHLFHAGSPLGPWRPHPLNPVVSDARCARPAGRLFRWRGDLYRPAQDCSRHYGHAVVLRRVVRLDTEEYEEETVSTIPPRWYPGLLATHTFNRCEGLTVVDGLRRIPRLPWR